MTTDVVTIPEAASLKEAARLLVDHRISGIPVLDASNRVVGVLSEADFVSAAEQRGSLGRLLVRFFANDGLSADSRRGPLVRDAMSHPARTIGPDDSVIQAARVMGRFKINRLPVVENDGLVGIVTRADIVNVYTRPDAELFEDAKAVLEPFPGIKLVEVVDGVAVIAGRVAHEGLAEAAKSQVAGVAGIVHVDATALTWRAGIRSE